MIFGNIVNIIIWLVILGLVWWLIGLIPLPSPIGQIIGVLVIVLAVLIVLSFFGLVNIGVPRLYK
jgi:hypothetical protein